MDSPKLFQAGDLNSAIHPLHRIDALPVELAAQVVRNSNGIWHIARRLLIRLATHLDAASAAETERACLGFEDCVPMTPPVAQESSAAVAALE